ncbi:MAG: hypothetical protein JSW12_03575 [Deltaproteobacteria bacterium]|nr:MAG: hypothetical protein JSW12_03575 [Deltaproteobacteria bacterium]
MKREVTFTMLEIKRYGVIEVLWEKKIVNRDAAIALQIGASIRLSLLILCHD